MAKVESSLVDALSAAIADDPAGFAAALQGRSELISALLAAGPAELEEVVLSGLSNTPGSERDLAGALSADRDLLTNMLAAESAAVASTVIRMPSQARHDPATAVNPFTGEYLVSVLAMKSNRGPQ